MRHKMIVLLLLLAPPSLAAFSEMPGWPLTILPVYPLTIDLVDLDMDGADEIFVAGLGFVNPTDPHDFAYYEDQLTLYAWDHNKKMVINGTRFELPILQYCTAFGDINGDEKTEILLVLPTSVWVLDKSANPLLPSPISLPSLVQYCGLSDLDNDGRDDIIVSTSEHGLYAITFDKKIVGNFPVNGVTGTFAIGDINGDGYEEIILADSNKNKLYAISREGEVLAGWPFEFTSDILSIPVLADFGDGKLSVVIAAEELKEWAYGLYKQNIYIISGNGSLVKSFTLEAVPAKVFEVILSDINLDDKPEIIVSMGEFSGGAWGEGAYIYIYDSDGNIMPGWPEITSGLLTTYVGDFNEDYGLEIYPLMSRGFVGFNSTGSRIKTTFPTYDIYKWVYGAIGKINEDEQLDFVFSFGRALHVYQTGYASKIERKNWLMQGHDNRHTSNLEYKPVIELAEGLKRELPTRWGLIANSIDYQNTYDILNSMRIGFEYLGPAGNGYKEYDKLIILGGPDAPLTGKITETLMTEEEKSKIRSPGMKKAYIIENHWKENQTVYIFAGYNRAKTREALLENKDIIPIQNTPQLQG